MFFLGYLRNELVRRKSRTILTVLGLAVGVALVIAVSALSRGLDRAQAAALDPLSSIGTDLTVTLAPQQDQAGGQGGGFGGGGSGGGGREVIQANQSVITDLSKLGKPGAHFVHDFFLPGTQLTFPQSSAQQIAKVPGVASVSSGLVLAAVHQEGTVPKIVAKIKTGGQQLRIDQQIKPPTAAEFAAMQACLAKAGIQFGGGQGGGGAQGGQGGQGGLGGGQGGLGGGQAGGRTGDRTAFRKCLPARLQRFRATVTTPQQTLQQVVNPPQTNIESATYTIAGVDPAAPAIGVVTPALVSRGRFLSAGSGAHEALLAASYANRQGLKIGSKLDLNGTTFTVVGFVRPPLGGQTADVYVPLLQLQALASQKGVVNVVLVRAETGASVAQVQQQIKKQFPRAQVASAKQVADSISGSLVDASNLSKRLGTALAVLAAAAAFLLAVLLTLASVGKRVREIGTLKALGWTQWLVVRQIVGESLAQGLLGGLLGVLLGILVSVAIGAFGPTLSASSNTGGGDGFFGLGQVTARSVTDQVALTAPIAVGVLVIGFALAVVGGLVAGTAGALRASGLRPADALRQVE
jgi:ABC-type antimicrobial peptide transport system permease subunit